MLMFHVKHSLHGNIKNLCIIPLFRAIINKNPKGKDYGRMNRKKHPIMKITASAAGVAVVSVELINRFFFSWMAGRSSLSESGGKYHSWKHGDFFYQRIEGGGGWPVLLLHELSPDKSSEQCGELALSLSEKRTVYTMDLLGCGRSARPAVTYSNFLYVLQTLECVEKIIGQPVHLVAQGNSAGIAIAASRYQPECFHQITLLDPPEKVGKTVPDRESRLRKKLIEVPVLGTLLYNLAFYKSAEAHIGGENARFLYASMEGHYTDFDVEWMLSDMKIPVHVIRNGEKADEREE